LHKFALRLEGVKDWMFGQMWGLFSFEATGWRRMFGN